MSAAYAPSATNINPQNSEPNVNTTQTGSGEPPRFSHTGSGYWGGAYYPYWSLMVMTVLGGFFGLDHFFLRSPTSGLLKAFINTITFGSWWVYDMIQIFHDKQSVLKNGLTIPALGASGIAAGVFTDKPGTSGKVKGPWLYFLFLFVSIFPYTFGLDSFIAGDIFGGVFKLSGILILPLFFIFLQKFLELYRIYITPDVFFEKGLPRLPGVNFLIGDWGCHRFAPEDFEGLCAGGLLGFALTLLPATTAAVDGIVAAPFLATQAATTVVVDSIKLADDAVKAAQGTLGQVAKVGQAVRSASQLASKVSQAETAAISTASAAARPDSIKAEATKRGLVGGGEEGLSSAALIFVTSLIIGGGLYQGGLRIKQLIKQNGASTRDDSPP